MSRQARVPAELTSRPFSLSEARSAGLTMSSLKGKAWRRIGARLYSWNGLRDDPWLTLAAWRRSLPDASVFIEATAAWMLGLDLRPMNPIEVAVPKDSRLRSRSGLSVRHREISPAEVVKVNGLPATSLYRTLIAICAHWEAVEALVAIDMAVHRRLTTVPALRRYATASRSPGAHRLRSLSELAEAAESPMETRLRRLLIEAQLPRPEVQTRLHDNEGRFVGRADLYYSSHRLVLEYDGNTHRERLVADNRRQNALINAGFRVLRFTAADLYQHPDAILAQVRSALQPPSPAVTVS